MCSKQVTDLCTCGRATPVLADVKEDAAADMGNDAAAQEAEDAEMQADPEGYMERLTQRHRWAAQRIDERRSRRLRKATAGAGITCWRSLVTSDCTLTWTKLIRKPQCSGDVLFRSTPTTRSSFEGLRKAVASHTNKIFALSLEYLSA